MIIYDFKFYDGMFRALRLAGIDHDSPAYQLAHEVWELRNIAACPIPPARNWDRREILRDFRAAVKRAGGVEKLLERMIRPIASKANTGSEHWVHEADIDETMGWCGNCVRHVTRHARRHGSPHAIVDGGWGIENDYPSWCNGCGVYLDETILQHDEEIDRFDIHGLSDNAVDCCILLDCLPNAQCILNEDDEEQQEHHAEIMAKVRRIALWFFARYPQHRPARKRRREVMHRG